MANPGVRKHLPSKKWLSLLIMAPLVLAGLSSGITAFSQAPPGEGPLAVVTVTATKVEWQPKVPHAGLVLSIAGPGDLTYQQEFVAGSVPAFGLTDANGQPYPGGSYTYELVVVPVVDAKLRAALEKARRSGSGAVVMKRQVQSGHFAIRDGVFVTSTASESGPPTEDVLHYDDVIVTGSLCVGFDCANGEPFGYCTQKYKENNLQVCFTDTSVGSFPTNDWKIQINDTTSGGASYFTIWDLDGGRRPFTIEAGAPAHSLYVEDYGRVGLGTSVPYVELHIVDGDTPTVRLDQDGSSGWTAQRWDLCGNETNFFIRDVTNGSKLTFRIEPNTPSNTFCMRSSGYVGIGTWSPAYPLELETTNENAVFALDRTDGATAKFSATNDKSVFGSVTNHKVVIVVNESKVAEFDTSGNLLIDGTLSENAWGNAKESETLRGRVAALQTENAALKARVDDLEKRMAALEAKAANGAAPTSSLLPGAGLLLVGLALSLPVGLVWVARRGSVSDLFKR